MQYTEVQFVFIYSVHTESCYITFVSLLFYSALMYHITKHTLNFLVLFDAMQYLRVNFSLMCNFHYFHNTSSRNLIGSEFLFNF